MGKVAECRDGSRKFLKYVLHHSACENIHALRRLVLDYWCQLPANYIWHGYVLTESLVMSSIKNYVHQLKEESSTTTVRDSTSDREKNELSAEQSTNQH